MLIKCGEHAMDKRMYVALLSLVLIAGCASGPRNYRYSAENKSDVTGTGVVFGKICGGQGLIFKNEETSEEILHIGGSPEFALRLPSGKYHLDSIGSGIGDYDSQDPFRFEVLAGEIVYVGTILPSWYYNEPKYLTWCAKELNSIVSHKDYHLHGSSSPVRLANDKDEAEKAVKQRYPNLDLNPSAVRLMH